MEIKEGKFGKKHLFALPRNLGNIYVIVIQKHINKKTADIIIIKNDLNDIKDTSFIPSVQKVSLHAEILPSVFWQFSCKTPLHPAIVHIIVVNTNFYKKKHDQNDLNTVLFVTQI